MNNDKPLTTQQRVDQKPEVTSRRGHRVRGSRLFRTPRIRKTILPGRQGLTGPRNTNYEHGFWEWSPTKTPPWKSRAKNRRRNKLARESRKANR